MDMNNLDINVLYFLCHPAHRRDRQHACRVADILHEFSDLPEHQVLAVVERMRAGGLIRWEPLHTRLTITESGIDRLQSSIACRVHRFDRCQCGTPG